MKAEPMNLVYTSPESASTNRVWSSITSPAFPLSYAPSVSLLNSKCFPAEVVGRGLIISMYRSPSTPRVQSSMRHCTWKSKTNWWEARWEFGGLFLVEIDYIKFGSFEAQY